ncbi:MAG: ATP-binding cassette, subfamily multidrug efflux pump, partial [Actinomycetota bacterium]|nr:ATP-binding cassette, subfamily multidrug efflux pump [Actinomycetota bacterium]
MSTTETEMPPPAPKKEPMPQQRLGSGPGRFGALGMPAEKTADFRGSLKRLLAMLRRERFGFGAVVFLALASVSLSVIGPKILGRATDVIFTGLTHGGPSAINFPSLHRVLWFVV